MTAATSTTGQDGEALLPHYADNPFKLHAEPALLDELKIAFIGNSLTLHDASAEIGWHHAHGMAASQPGLDYAHQLLARLRLDERQAYIRNFYPFESDLAVAPGHIASLAPMLARRPPLIVVQLGDNIGNQEQLQNFAQNLNLLVATLRQHCPQVYCVSTWWVSPPKDQVIEAVCGLYGAHYVHIGDLFDHPANSDRQRRDYAHQGVELHPKDWGMAQIGERLFRAILGQLLRPLPAP